MPNGPPRTCIYPGSYATRSPILQAIQEIATNKADVSSFYLDTLQSMSRFLRHMENHAQAIARSHVLSDRSVVFFLACSFLDTAGAGTLSSYRYRGPFDNAHVLDAQPRVVAKMEAFGTVGDTHPSDICFLAEVDELDGGYVFVAEEFEKQKIGVFHFDLSGAPALLDRVGDLPFRFEKDGPNLITIDRVGDTYFLIAGSTHWGYCQVFVAKESDIFPKCQARSMLLTAFKPLSRENRFNFPITTSKAPSQIKLVKDSIGAWSLLAFRGDPPDRERATDYVDIYPVSFNPFSIGPLIKSVHIFLRSGDTSFANTGTHFVERSGRLLISSSYRWAENEGPEGAAYVHRVDEVPSD
jgi:hypothetical protein